MSNQSKCVVDSTSISTPPGASSARRRCSAARRSRAGVHRVRGEDEIEAAPREALLDESPVEVEHGEVDARRAPPNRSRARSKKNAETSVKR